MNCSAPWDVSERPGSGVLFGSMPDWYSEAACRNVTDPDLFFPRRGEPTRAAKEICRSCPVAAQCLDYALNFKGADDYGVWGGASVRERRRLKRHRSSN